MRDTQVGVKIAETEGRKEKKKGKFKAVCRWTINYTPWKVSYYKNSISELHACVMTNISGSVLISYNKMEKRRLARLERDYSLTIKGHTLSEMVLSEKIDLTY